MRIFCTAKVSHIFSTKYNSVFVILTFENLTKRFKTIDFEQPAPEHLREEVDPARFAR